MTFGMVWMSFWSGVAGGVVGYYATDWLYGALIRRRMSRAWDKEAQKIASGGPYLPRDYSHQSVPRASYPRTSRRGWM